MISIDQLLVFSLTSLLLIFTPGPDIIHVLTRGVAQGRSAALAAAMGFSLGNIGHTLLAVFGLSAILASSALAFTLVKIAGGIYLLYLGFKLWTADPALVLSGHGEDKTARIIFRQSILANLLNPKVAIFFLAFFPQFVRPDQGHPAMQMMVLGLTFVVLTMLGFGLVALGAGALNSRLAARPSLSAWLHKGAGAILMLLGLRLLWADR
ncbi:Threonine/homoserine/homoserine lactone efflux protein [Desulfomicrobium norvegicum]|uniref:Threonine/homoserine/homoserine lactone efflux protein n=1 Tax=Desulfomicrobium norvegicum (strain DSM 1741 / NCIMB 8310) TaxID=52561 RepID=A0A8G2F4V1_DESNO|nr:LysE family translocator [Desulfomicrobium norvegicum]SFL35334.1 Threonine/homoserine/homoserine lactone efflux protein [Desulfomicrobium norvegicum]